MNLQELFTEIATDVWLDRIEDNLVIAHVKMRDDPDAWIPFQQMFLQMMVKAYSTRANDAQSLNLKHLQAYVTYKRESHLPKKYAGEIFLDDEQHIPVLTFIIKEKNVNG